MCGCWSSITTELRLKSTRRNCNSLHSTIVISWTPIFRLGHVLSKTRMLRAVPQMRPTLPASGGDYQSVGCRRNPNLLSSKRLPVCDHVHLRFIISAHLPSQWVQLPASQTLHLRNFRASCGHKGQTGECLCRDPTSSSSEHCLSTPFHLNCGFSTSATPSLQPLSSNATHKQQ
jgi:hypothetical protein